MDLARISQYAVESHGTPVGESTNLTRDPWENPAILRFQTHWTANTVFDKMKKHILIIGIIVLAGCGLGFSQETLPPLKDGKAPQTVEALWADFDPRAEPLEVEILKEWEEDGVVMRVLRYRIGMFKGRKAMMAAVYGYPKGGTNLPGLVQIHGGGQYADYRAVLTNGKRGYATISISWAGRIHAPDYRVDPKVVKLFFANATDDPNYKLTTDWGALDGYHAPSRNPGNQFPRIPVGSWTLDAVASPRNNSWFLCALGARRALTFLERQPEVDPEKLGVYGHSMGGKLTVLTVGADERVKAAAPSCGGVSDRYNDDPLFAATLADDVYLKRITCPIIFLSPSNDFHGRINDLQTALGEVRSDDWRITCSAHHNHQDHGDFEVAGLLWFDQYLKGTFTFPETPKSALRLNTEKGVPAITVAPDSSKPILSVEIYYTQQGPEAGEIEERENRINRFWHYAHPGKTGDTWTADLPLESIDKPLWVYANVRYPLEEPVTGAGYYYRVYSANTFTLSSRMHIASPAQLKANGVQASLQPSQTIETFKGDWEKDWFTYKSEGWGRRTHKVYSDLWKAPPKAKLALDARSAETNKMIVSLDRYIAEVALGGGKQWQTLILSPHDFLNIDGDTLADWSNIKELGFEAEETIRNRVNDEVISTVFGGEWTGADPEFRNLRWIME